MVGRFFDLLCCRFTVSNRRTIIVSDTFKPGSFENSAVARELRSVRVDVSCFEYPASIAAACSRRKNEESEC